ncbi:hydrolase [Streptomyces sp. ACA25]|uniref:hydrolase n=1 Tax=Streptomyces sp. ACA25 TaxID=3022596 RepID=UPI002306E251|nr:hydrolase [Streptomyces sp. ACA25]MDB1089548.1 hydrolase [Streptomyces sp. ACA25]
MLTGIRTDTGLVPAAERTALLAGGYAAEADRTRALHPEVVEAIAADGFARHLVASRWGGAEGSFEDLTRAVIRVGEGCAATAWCASLAAYSARIAAHLPAEGQRQLWGAGPDTAVAAGLIPSGKAVPAEGGWRLSGSWGYVSGVDFADWVLLCAAAGSGEGPPELRFLAVPRGGFTVRRTWDNTGMRATGSHTVTVEDVLVPEALTFARPELLSGRNAGSSLPAHNVPFQALSGLTFLAPAVGAAAGALAACAATLTGRRRTETGETRLVHASGLVHAARHLVEENARTADQGLFSPQIVARSERNAACAAQLLQEALDLLVRAGGTSGLTVGAPLERFWRDVTSATSHVALQYGTSAARSYAAVLIGPPE